MYKEDPGGAKYDLLQRNPICVERNTEDKHSFLDEKIFKGGAGEQKLCACNKHEVANIINAPNLSQKEHLYLESKISSR